MTWGSLRVPEAGIFGVGLGARILLMGGTGTHWRVFADRSGRLVVRLPIIAPYQSIGMLIRHHCLHHCGTGHGHRG